MTSVQMHNLKGKEVEKIELNDSVFGLPANDDLVYQVYVALGANKRQVLAHTKTRSERAGSGIKPWRQKGTGRARVGSVRTPVWRKGGVAFGPTKDRNFEKKINKKMNAKAIATVLSGKIKDNEMTIIDKFELTGSKTKEMAGTLKNLKIEGTVLLIFSESEKKAVLASRNLAKATIMHTKQLNVFEMLNHKNLILSKESAKFLEEKYKKTSGKKISNKSIKVDKNGKKERKTK